MDRREFIGLVGGAAAWPVAARAQPAGTGLRRIGYLSPGVTGKAGRFDECFLAGLRDLGWSDGKNIDIVYKWSDSSLESFAENANEIVRLKPDVIVASSTPATLATKLATDTIPIVFLSVSDPVANGIANSLARPGGNLTGVSNFLPATTAKLLELIMTIAPRTSRVGILFNPTNPGKMIEVGELRTAAESLRVQLVPIEVTSFAGIQRALTASVEAGCDSLITLVDGVTSISRAEIIEFLSRKRLLGVYQVRNFVDAGGLISYGLNYCRHFRRAASYVDRILKGARPGDLPIEQPTEFELVINTKMAKTLGIDIPPALLARADEVIE